MKLTSSLCTIIAAEILGLCDSYSLQRREFYFDRSPRIFENILGLYRKGELHLTERVCPRDFLGKRNAIKNPFSLVIFYFSLTNTVLKRRSIFSTKMNKAQILNYFRDFDNFFSIGGELEYWGLSALHLEPCCAYTLQRASWLLPIVNHGIDTEDEVVSDQRGIYLDQAIMIDISPRHSLKVTFWKELHNFLSSFVVIIEFSGGQHLIDLTDKPGQAVAKAINKTVCRLTSSRENGLVTLDFVCGDCLRILTPPLQRR